MSPYRVSLFVVGLLLGVLTVDRARGDSVELVNGDKLTGKVLSVGEKTLTLENDALGQISVLRSKVATIKLGRAVRSDSVDNQRPAGRESGDRSGDSDVRPSDSQLVKELRARGLDIQSLDNLRAKIPPIKLPADKRPSQTPEDVVQRLQTHGLPPGALDDLETRIPLLAVPGVRGYFNRTLEGLLAGELGIPDIRRDAIKARDGLRDIQKDLGPDGAALDGYKMILDGFIEQTAPKKVNGNQR